MRRLLEKAVDRVNPVIQVRKTTGSESLRPGRRDVVETEDRLGHTRGERKRSLCGGFERRGLRRKGEVG